MNPLDTLGIDGWSILLHMVNVFSLVVILTFVLHKPLMNFVDARRQKIIDSVEGIEQMKEEFNSKLETMEKEKEMMLEAFHTQMQEGKKALEAQRDVILAEAKQTKEQLMTEATVEIERRKERLMTEVQHEVLTAMEKIILHVLQNNVDKKVIEESISDQWQRHISHRS